VPPAANTPKTPRPEEDIRSDVNTHVIKIQRIFEKFLMDNVQLPHWQPPLNLPDEVRKYIIDLKIPVISPSSQTPSLLFHKLGQPSHDPQLDDRVKGLFGQEPR